ncbi:MAG: alpha-amylase family glycosyl hydrolase [Maritimibacter sp.]
MTQLVKDPDWWRGAVIYQVYPRSYQDDNGDGIGDLAGITRRLDHIADLGVDAVWISPFFPSPMKDFGYDVSEYCDVDPMFGSLADFDRLIARAHDLNLKVMIDLVLSHSSDQHPWFAQSARDALNDKADWYVWADAKPDGGPPNNWLSIFGGSAWAWAPGRMQYYLHNFLTSQPDLNFHSADVRAALLDVARFWLARGVDGFRLDTINFYAHDARLRDNPALDPAQRNATIAPAVNPYNWQEHLYDKNRPETLSFLRDLRAVMQPYNAAAVGEVGDAQRGLEIMGEYTAGPDLMHMCYAFELLSGDRPTATFVARLLQKVEQVAPQGWAAWAFSNHDVVRHMSRWELSEAAARGLVTLLMCLKGSACIYQGEEFGLSEADVAFDELQDPYGIEFWPAFKGRDGCRTPMVWQPEAPFGGFSPKKPWLPVSPDHIARLKDETAAGADALIHHYRRAIALRHAHPALAKGDLSGLAVNGDVVSFERRLGEDAVFFALNMADVPGQVARPEGAWTVIEGADLGQGAYEPLAPWQALILRRQKEG